MKTEQEIRERIKIYKKIKDKSSVLTNEFSLEGAIAALEWVLRENKEGDTVHEYR